MQLPRSALRQYGAFTGYQAREAGWSRAQLRHAVTSGRLRTPYRGVFVDLTLRRPPFTGWAAALLACGPAAALAGHSAAQLLALPSLPGYACSPGACVAVPATRRPRGGPTLTVRRSRFLEPADTCRTAHLRALSLPRLLVDLCAVLAEGDRQGLVASLLQTGRVTVSALQEAHRRYSRLRGGAQLGAVLAALQPGRQSAFEVDLARWITEVGLPPPISNAPVPTALGIVHPDFFWPAPRVAIEAQGAAFHLDERSWNQDLRRLEALRDAGIEVLQLSWRQFQQDRDALAGALHATLSRRWPSGQPGRP